MKLFVGLGNPGTKYAGNRHNIGFMAVDQIQADHGFAPWRSKFQGQVSEGVLAGEKVILLKPETFMNLSGQSVGEAMRFYKLDSTDVTVFHDELDLPPFKVKLKLGGGHAGHNGLRSIHQHIGPHYGRVRLGVGHPGHKDKVSPYVLSDFAKQEHKWLDDLMRGISDGAEHLVDDDNAKFTNAVALRTGGQKPKAEKPAPKPTAPAESDAQPARTEEPPAPEDTRSPLQKLADKFR
ncbi:aminoacyl-tRNA hydrolase [Maritimibacter sp. UBA3975]|uniref:aminoacyl-tRNA hydrolase n=1 Tax=Maritimibacter sp. UBA3975 TaxID=1946833 RepID=UPI000C0BB821|nr:aminoacyl-tRNA hydrolase [Maritimibacter sp. UBA3975]MAM60384.1 aminoacyl-tRNA hydrolase [Maritimibacter sp.]|tara:strand:+ start:2828 stop:3535 length:708 start_codon:yes stop_codon:yes gene_type:complete